MNSFIERHSLSFLLPEQKSYTWSVPQSKKFHELLLSWNAERPQKGHYVFLTSLYLDDNWTPWLLFAIWGKDYQFSFHETSSQCPVRTFQDQVEVLRNKMASGFKIKILACGGATLVNFYDLYVCASSFESMEKVKMISPSYSSIVLSVKGLSQISLKHPRSMSMCSPTSTTAVINYLSKKEIEPSHFSKNVYDSAFDIYGNWSFNVAQAFVELGSKWGCFCARSSGFKTIMQNLKKNLPVVVSIKGSLQGSFIPFQNGHLLVVIGYDAQSKQVLCMDPAFPSNKKTCVSYLWEDFMEAWKKRHFLSYIFYRR